MPHSLQTSSPLPALSRAFGVRALESLGTVIPAVIVVITHTTPAGPL